MASDDVHPVFASQPRRNRRTAAMQHAFDVHGGVQSAAAGVRPADHHQQHQLCFPRHRSGAASAAMHSHGDDLNSSGGESDGLDRNGGGGGQGEAGGGGDMDSKRRRRLELNRKAAKESRRRKKMRIEELGRSVVFLTRENQELREQNEFFRQMVASEVAPDSTALTKFQASNAALRMALYDTDKSPSSSLSRHQPHRLHQSEHDVDGSGGSGKGPGGLSLSDHPMSGPVPSLAAAAAAVGNSPLPPSSSGSPPPHSMLTSLSPPPGGSSSVSGGGGGLGGDKLSPASSSSLHSPPAASMMMQSSLHQLPSAVDNKGNVGSNGNGDDSSRPGGGLTDGAAGGVPVSGGGNRMIAPAGVGAPFISGGGLGVLASLTGGGRDRDAASGGRSLHPKSMSTFVSIPTGGGGSGGAVGGGGAAGRSAGPQHLQQASTYGDGAYGTEASASGGRKLDRGGGGSGAGSASGGGVGGPGGLDYAEMMARASANAAMMRARTMQQQHNDSGGGGGGSGSGGAGSGPAGGNGGSRRGPGGGWTSSWPAWESSATAGSAPESVERGL